MGYVGAVGDPRFLDRVLPRAVSFCDACQRGPSDWAGPRGAAHSNLGGIKVAMTLSLADMGAILPEILLASYACAVLILAAFIPRERGDILAYASLVALGLAGFATSRLMWVDLTVLGGMFILDPYSNFFKLVLYGAAALTILLSLSSLT